MGLGQESASVGDRQVLDELRRYDPIESSGQERKLNGVAHQPARVGRTDGPGILLHNVHTDEAVIAHQTCPGLAVGAPILEDQLPPPDAFSRKSRPLRPSPVFPIPQSSIESRVVHRRKILPNSLRFDSRAFPFVTCPAEFLSRRTGPAFAHPLSMIVAHLSDTHLGFSEFDDEDPEGGFNLRELDAYRAFEEACRKVRVEKPDLVVHTGDVFDRPRPPIRALTVALRGFHAMAREGTPVVVLAGNHDLPALRGTACPLEILPTVSGMCAIWEGPATLRFGECAVHAIPHAVDERALREAVESARPDPKARYNILAVHAGLRDSGEREWSEARVPRDILLRKARDFDYIALGHYHRPTDVAPMIRYAGSTERFHPEENPCERGFLVADLGARSVRRVPISTRPIVELDSLDCGDLSPTEISARMREAASDVPAGAVVRITLTRLSRDLDLLSPRRAIPQALKIELRREYRRKRGAKSTGAVSEDPIPVQFERFLAEHEKDEELRQIVLELARGYFRAAETDDS